MNSGDLIIDPSPKPEEIESASYDLKIGRVLGRIDDVIVKDKEPAEYILGVGETAVVLTQEKIYLSEKLGGYVSLTNKMASLGVHLLNPGHVDPGWGGRDPIAGRNEGLELTAFVKNISDQPVKLVQKAEFLTLTLSQLDTPTQRPYWQINVSPYDRLSREAKLAKQARDIARFNDPQRKVNERMEELETNLKSKVSWKDLMTPLSVLIAGLGIVVSVTIGIVTMSSQYSAVRVFSYDVSTPVFLSLLVPLLLVAATLPVYAIVSLVSIIKRRRSRDRS